jgi:hypothetical protein
MWLKKENCYFCKNPLEYFGNHIVRMKVMAANLAAAEIRKGFGGP